MKPYRGYSARIWFEADDRLFHGQVEGIRDTVHFSGDCVDSLEMAFHHSVDAYLDLCAEDGVAPDRPYSGRLAFRTTPEQHRMIAEAAAKSATSVNQWMNDALARAAGEVLGARAHHIRSA